MPPIDHLLIEYPQLIGDALLDSLNVFDRLSVIELFKGR